MKTSELTDRALLAWADEFITQRIQSIAIARCHTPSWSGRDEYYRGLEVGTNQGRSEMTSFLESLRNNIRLGMRCIDGELPQLGDHPWSEADADHDCNELTPVAEYVA